MEGDEDASKDEAAEDPDAVEGILDYETGEFTPIDRSEEDEEVSIDEPGPP